MTKATEVDEKLIKDIKELCEGYGYRMCEGALINHKRRHFIFSPGGWGGSLIHIIFPEDLFYPQRLNILKNVEDSILTHIINTLPFK